MFNFFDSPFNCKAWSECQGKHYEKNDDLTTYNYLGMARLTAEQNRIILKL